jgi:release factor glutamine methyltransferase
MNIRTALKEGIAQLRAARVDSFTLAAELLLLHVLGRDRTWLFTHPEDNLSEDEVHRFFASIERRAAGEPTQHLTGKQEFWSLEFEVTPDVLIPRRETEHVIEVALDRLALHELRAGRKQTTDGSGLLIADIGTGSGCIAVALAKELPAATICATDISAAALAVARRNAELHSVADRIRFLECKLLEKLEASAVGAQLHPEGKRRNADSLRGQDATLAENAPLATRDQSPVTNHQSPLFDLIVSNPPYIGRREAESLAREVREHEPQLALYGGEEGYEFYAELIAQTAQRLKPGGVLVLELGHNSLPAVQPLLDAPAWTNVAVTNDLAGIPRVIAAEKP